MNPNRMSMERSIGKLVVMGVITDIVANKIRKIRNDRKQYEVNIIADKKYFQLLSELSLVSTLQQRMNEQFFRKDCYSLMYEQGLDGHNISFACQVQEAFDPGIDLSDFYKQLGIDEEQLLLYSEVGEPDEYDTQDQVSEMEEDYLYYLKEDLIHDLQKQGYEIFSYKRLFYRMMEPLMETPI
ncbi:hypothetical protein [Paenibacillus humicus]|uniref:hypothetical protein n=1 Tax=Paenibacillus humicus TaxID=412861 RepID=UPI003D267211